MHKWIQDNKYFLHPCWPPSPQSHTRPTVWATTAASSSPLRDVKKVGNRILQTSIFLWYHQKIDNIIYSCESLKYGHKINKISLEHDRTRTCNPQIRSLVPYPLGHTPLLLVTYSSMKENYLLLKGKIFQHWLKCSNTHISTYFNIEQSVLIHDSRESDQVEEYY